MCRWAEKETAMEIKRRTVFTREMVTMLKHTASALSAGDIRLRNVRKTLDSLGIIRSHDQIRFHEAFIQACLPKSNTNTHRKILT
jgi:hypothetical protein